MSYASSIQGNEGEDGARFRAPWPRAANAAARVKACEVQMLTTPTGPTQNHATPTGPARHCLTPTGPRRFRDIPTAPIRHAATPTELGRRAPTQTEADADGTQTEASADEAVESQECSATQTGDRRYRQKMLPEQRGQTKLLGGESAAQRRSDADKSACCHQRRRDPDEGAQPGQYPDRKKNLAPNACRFARLMHWAQISSSSAVSCSPGRRAACSLRRRLRPDRPRRSIRR